MMFLKKNICAVSYTHLDVYKRQGQGREAVKAYLKANKDVQDEIYGLLKEKLNAR